MKEIYVVILHYKVALQTVEQFFAAHIEYIERYHASGIYVVSGRREPRVGGVLIATNCTRQQIEAIVADDPYNLNNIADFVITDFIPTRANKRLSHLMI